MVSPSALPTALALAFSPAFLPSVLAAAWTEGSSLTAQRRAQETPLDGANSAAEPRTISLQDCLGMSLANNLGLERAVVESEIARFDALSSWGAFDWVLDLRGSYTDSETASSTALAGADVVENQEQQFDLDITKPLTWGGSFAFHFDTQLSETNNQFFNSPVLVQDNLRLTYTQPLFRGRGVAATTASQRESEIIERQRREDRRLARQTLLHDVEVAYWELVHAGQLLVVAESALTLGQSQVDRELARVRAGDGTEVDVLQARTQVATTQEALLQARNDVAQRGDDLKQLIYAERDADSWDEPLEPSSLLPRAEDAPDLPKWQDAYELALGRRSDLRNAKLAVDANRVRLTRAQSDRLHGLDLQVIASSNGVDETSSGSLADATSFKFPTYTVALTYNVPLQNRTANNAERSAAERLRGSKIFLRESEMAALADIRRAVREVKFRTQAVLAAEQSLELARRQLDAEQKRFEADLTTTFEVLQFQQTWIEAQSTLSRATVEYANSLIGLKLAEGVVGERTR